MTTLYHRHPHEDEREQERERGRQEREPSSPLSSLPSSYHSLPEVTSMPEKPRAPSVPLPPASPLPSPDLDVLSSNIKQMVAPSPFPLPMPLNRNVDHAFGEEDGGFGVILPSEGQDSAVGNVTNALGLYSNHDHHALHPSEHVYRAKKRVEEPITKAPRKEETTFILRKPAPHRSSTNNTRDPHQHQQQRQQHPGIFDSFPSFESVTSGWPPSPSVTRSWKLATATATNLSHVAGGEGGKRKRNTSDDRDGVEDVLDASIAKKKTRLLDERWTSRPCNLSLGNQQDTSPDYRGMLNLSDTPPLTETEANLANIDPFTHSRNVAPPSTFQMFTAPAGGGVDEDESLSPTIRNPSIGSIDSEDLSIFCLAPAAGPAGAARELSFGRFGCSGNWEENVAACARDEVEMKRIKEEGERRLADVIERWIKGHAQASIATTASTTASSRNAVPRQYNEYPAAPTGTAVYDTAGGRGYLFKKPWEASNGLLDAVCEIEALAYERATGIEAIGSGYGAPQDVGVGAGPAAESMTGNAGEGLATYVSGPSRDARQNSPRRGEGAAAMKGDGGMMNYTLTLVASIQPGFQVNQGPFPMSNINSAYVTETVDSKSRQTTAGTGHRDHKTQSGAILAMVLKESSPIDFIPFSSLTIGCWNRFPKTNLEDTAESTFAYTPFEAGDQRFSWAMFHDNVHYRISIPFAAIQSLKCPAVPNNENAIALILTLNTLPLFHVWKDDPGVWRAVAAFIETDDLMTHCLVGSRTTLLPKVERILARTTSNQARMFEVPYGTAHVNGSQPSMQSRGFQRHEPEREVIDLVTPPRHATAQQSYPEAPKQLITPLRDRAGLNRRLIQKKKLGRDSSRVKMSLKSLTKKMPLKAGSSQPTKEKILVPYPYVQPLFSARPAVEVLTRASTIAGNLDQATTRQTAYQHRDQHNLGGDSRIDQYSFPQPRPMQDENLQRNAGGPRPSTLATCAPYMIQPPPGDVPHLHGGANMNGPFAVPLAFYGYFPYPPTQFSIVAPTAITENHQQLIRYPHIARGTLHQYHHSRQALHARPTTTSSTASMFQVGSMTTIVDRRTSVTSQATDISAALAGRQGPRH
ncbi:hypothetical protein QFC21_005089 [Naganishia friedmannii]|uniref:Uncharacterized protein n=1 Tax=Naganishia friedmannii TaxID=89922 RepID=A0ACC2VBR5_9TREE|nr:hypothetical protein QFC21_005089 [Naganishia friedmannii]